MDSLFNNGKFSKLEPGDVLYTSDEKCKYIGRVEKGSIRIVRMLKSGKEIVLKEFIAGDLFADLLVFSGDNYPGWIIANEESIVVEVGLESLLKNLKQEGETLSFLKCVSNKVSGLTNTIEILSLKTVKQKISYLLLYNSNKLIESPTISSLANKIGSSREAVSRTLSAMTQEGIIKKVAGKIEILDSHSLEDILNDIIT
ncbi:MAG: Crp/Fnr family transcriptional regulator [Spirochaetaceae bacterium]